MRIPLAAVPLALCLLVPHAAAAAVPLQQVPELPDGFDARFDQLAFAMGDVDRDRTADVIDTRRRESSRAAELTTVVRSGATGQVLWSRVDTVDLPGHIEVRAQRGSDGRPVLVLRTISRSTTSLANSRTTVTTAAWQALAGATGEPLWDTGLSGTDQSTSSPTGTFLGSTTRDVPDTSYERSYGDVVGDAADDMVLALIDADQDADRNRTESRRVVVLDGGTGEARELGAAAGGSSTAPLADLDGDRSSEIAVREPGPPATDDTVTSARRADGTTLWRRPELPAARAVQDLSGDGVPDLLLPESPDSVLGLRAVKGADLSPLYTVPNRLLVESQRFGPPVRPEVLSAALLVWAARSGVPEGTAAVIVERRARHDGSVRWARRLTLQPRPGDRHGDGLAREIGDVTGDRVRDVGVRLRTYGDTSQVREVLLNGSDGSIVRRGGDGSVLGSDGVSVAADGRGAPAGLNGRTTDLLRTLPTASGVALQAHDGLTGQRLWRASHPAPSPTQYDRPRVLTGSCRTLLVQAGTLEDARLYGLDAATGVARWSVDVHHADADVAGAPTAGTAAC